MILIDDSDDEIQDAAPSEGTVHSHTLTVLCSNKPCPNHVAQVPCQLGRDASDGISTFNPFPRLQLLQPKIDAMILGISFYNCL